jgi:hypothetical protein
LTIVSIFARSTSILIIRLIVVEECLSPVAMFFSKVSRSRKELVRFIVGCDSDEFKRYYRTLDGLHNYFKLLGIQDVRFGELGPTEEAIIKRDPSHLIIWRQGREIIGHAIWHEESINGFTEAGDEEVRESLERLLGEETGFTELHEVWLKELCRKE